MPLESVNFIEDMNSAWPTGTDPKNEGDDHLRNIKKGVQASFPNTTGAWNTIDQVKMGGADMGGAKVVDLAAPDNADEAVNLGTLTARLPGFLSWGTVGSTGDFANTPGSGDWTAVRLAVGHYELTFTRAVAGTGSLNTGIGITPVSQVDDVKVTCQPQADRTKLEVRLWAGNGNATDNIFSFIRMVS